MNNKMSYDNQMNQHIKSVDESLRLIREWGKDKGITGTSGVGTVGKQYAKLLEEVGELGGAIIENDTVEIIDAIGDCTVVLQLLCEIIGLRYELCIESAYDVIKGRSGSMVNGQFVKDFN